MKHDALQRLLVEHLNSRPVPPHAAARRSAWAMAMVTALSVGYLGWTEWSAPSDADVDIALLTSDLPVEAYLHPNFTRDL